MLLALAAAERGHTVLVGRMPHEGLLRRSGRRWLLPPGVFHAKALTPTPRKLSLHRSLRERGFRITSQDEENGISAPSYEFFARTRFSETSLELADHVFAWGSHDADALRSFYPRQASTITLSGSPRADLWKPAFERFHDPRGESSRRDTGHVLIVSSMSPFTRTSFSERLTRHRMSSIDSGGELGSDHWSDLFGREGAWYVYMGEMLRAVRAMSERLPDVRFVVRPHPAEDPAPWEQLLGDRSNIVVTGEGTLHPWIRGARVTIHNGSSAAFEAASAGLPLVSFQPGGIRSDELPNQLGRVAGSVEELVSLVEEAGEARSGDAWHSVASVAALNSRLNLNEPGLAVDRIVDHWSELPEEPSGGAQLDRKLAHAAFGVRTETSTRSWRPRARAVDDPKEKFPAISSMDAEDLLDRFRGATGRFDQVSVNSVNDRLLLVRPA